MRITGEQQKILDSLVCERLSSNGANFREVDNFYNHTNDSIAEVLRSEAYGEDDHGSVAYVSIL